MNDTFLNKVPPQNIEAEESIIASLLLDTTGQAVLEVLDIISADDFYKSSNKKIFNSMYDLAEAKEPVDLVTVKNKLMENGDLEDIGGAGQLANIIDYTPGALNIKNYCKIIKQKSEARKLIDYSSRAIQSLYDQTSDFKEVLDDFQNKVLSVGGDSDFNFRRMPEIIQTGIERYEFMNKGGVKGIKTGFHELDSLTGGFAGPLYIIIAARTRIGKTSMMLTMARNMARRGHKVGIFELEMSESSLINRFFAMETGINSIRFNSGLGPNKDEWSKILKSSDKMNRWNIMLDDTGGLKISELKRRCRLMKKQGAEIIFIDQFSKITGGQGTKEYEKKTDICNKLADFKKELGIPIVLLAQISRGAENRNIKNPILADLKSTGSLEEDADIILLGHREYEYTKDEDQENESEWDLAKHRDGPERKIDLYWDSKTTTFKDLEVYHG